MRVTTDMIFSQTMFNLGRNLERFMRVESMLSSGRRINTPSDDPVGTPHALNYRTHLSEIEQYRSNINQGMGWMATYDSGLGDLNGLYSAAKEIAIMMANDTYDEVARQGAANEVAAIFEQVLQLANAEMGGRYMFAGHRTRTKPMLASANGVTYVGDRGIIELEMDVNSRLISNLIGEDVFLKQLTVLGGESDLRVGLTDATFLADLNLGNGVELLPGTFEVYDRNKDITYTIDLSSAVTVGDAVTAINTQLGAAAGLSIRIADAGSSLQWEPVTGAANSVTVNTPLSNLNGGTGVDLDPGTLRIRNADGSISVEVDISGAATLGDVITAIDSALIAGGVAGVTVGFNTDGTGLALTDTNGLPLGLQVEETMPNSSTASDLGILGVLAPVLEGADLSPRPDFVIRDIGTQTTAKDLGILGSVEYSRIGDSVRPRLVLDTPVSVLNNGLGFGLGQLKISQGDQMAIIDLGDSTIVTVADLLGAINGCGLEVSASINAAATGIQIVPTVSNKTLIIESNDETRTAHNLGIIGSSDMLGTLMLLTRALRNNDRELAEILNGTLLLSMDELLSARATVGARVIRMETTRNRLEASNVNVTRMLSEVEDADIVELVSDLAREENAYQAALLASSKVMQQSLIDFLR